MNNFNFAQFQTAISNHSNEFAKAFTAHATKIAVAQQSWLQSQADAVKNQLDQFTNTKDLASTAQSIQNSVQPAAESVIKHTQQLFNLTLDAQKELAAKIQDGYQAFAIEANTAVDATIKQMPNEGEPFVGIAKNASQLVVNAFEQASAHVKTAQTNYEAQIAKLFDSALSAVSAPVAAKPVAKQAKQAA